MSYTARRKALNNLSLLNALYAIKEAMHCIRILGGRARGKTGRNQDFKSVVRF